MNKCKFNSKKACKSVVTAILVISAIFGLSLSAIAEDPPQKAAETPKGKVLRQVAQDWIEIGVEQYKRGYFAEAEQSFSKAADYEEYLSSEQHKILDDYRGKIAVSMQQNTAADAIANADKLAGEGKLVEARSSLEKIKDSPSLTDEQRRMVADKLTALNQQIKAETDANTRLYKQSVMYYQNGELEKARDGFLKVAKSGLPLPGKGKTAEEYLLEIDQALVNQIKAGGTIDMNVARPEERPAPVATLPTPSLPKVKPAPAAKPKTTEEESLTRRKNITINYTNAVIKKVTSDIQADIDVNQFDKARADLRAAGEAIESTRPILGQDTIEHYQGQLNDLRKHISESETKYIQQQLVAQKKQQISEMLSAAESLFQQKRYQEAQQQLDAAQKLLKELPPESTAPAAPDANEPAAGS